MKMIKKTKGFMRSWGTVIFLLLMMSFFVAATSVYAANCLLEWSLEQEYVHYIWKQRYDENKYELQYNDGIYKRSVRCVLEEKATELENVCL